MRRERRSWKKKTIDREGVFVVVRRSLLAGELAERAGRTICRKRIGRTIRLFCIRSCSAVEIIISSRNKFGWRVGADGRRRVIVVTFLVAEGLVLYWNRRSRGLSVFGSSIQISGHSPSQIDLTGSENYTMYCPL